MFTRPFGALRAHIRSCKTVYIVTAHPWAVDAAGPAWASFRSLIDSFTLDGVSLPLVSYGMIPRHDHPSRRARARRPVGDRPPAPSTATSSLVGRSAPHIPDRNCFAAIVFMARTSTPWRLLPAQELGCGSPATVWRRLNQWATAGVFEQLHLEILDRLGVAGRLDWSRASLDSMSVHAKHGGTTLAQVRSIAASPGPSCTWSARGVGCR